MKNLPVFIQDRLKNQEKTIDFVNDRVKKFESLTNKIAKKTERAVENLVTGDSENYRVKKEINDLIEFQKPLSEQFGINTWYELS